MALDTLTPRRDLIGKLYAERRRRIFRGVLLGVGVICIVLIVVFTVQIKMSRRAVAIEVSGAGELLASGTLSAFSEAEQALQRSLDAHESADARAGLAFVRSHRAMEFGVDVEGAREALAEVADVDHRDVDAVVARGFLSLHDGEIDVARGALTTARERSEPTLAVGATAYLAAVLAVASGEDVPGALAGLNGVLATDPEWVAYRRLQVALLLEDGQPRRALEELTRLRTQARGHFGLAADEAIYNARLRQRLPGVASLADQLISTTVAGDEGPAPFDRARAKVARAAVHIYGGERREGVALLEEAWPNLPKWDRPTHIFAVELAMEAGRSEVGRAFLDELALSSNESGIIDAWAKLVDGDAFGSLALLAGLPQQHPRVAYLQGLALVEQGRFVEAKPWLERADTLAPGSVEIEVGLARTLVATGDPEAGLRKLKGLAAEEPFAPRVWTGLGEAHLALVPKPHRMNQASREDLSEATLPSRAERDATGEHLDAAEEALTTALERERVPAAALSLLADAKRARWPESPGALGESLELRRRAVEENESDMALQEQLGLALADFGLADEARGVLRGLVDQDGVTAAAPLMLVRLELERADRLDLDVPSAVDGWLDQAEAAGADGIELDKARALVKIVRGGRRNLEQAHLELGSILEADPHDVEARLLYARALHRQSRFKLSVTALRRAFNIDPEGPNGRLYLEWARYESQAGGRRKAAVRARIGWIRLIEEQRPAADLVEAGTLTAGLFMRDKKILPALTVSRELVDLVPDHPLAHATRARVLLRNNQTKEAGLHAKKAVELGPNDAEAHLVMGHVHGRLGQGDQAREHYTIARSNAETSALRAEIDAAIERLE